MSVSLTGSRSPDDRRRRRLAVAGDGTDAGDLDAGGIALLRERIGEFPSASPWLPRQPWKRNALIGSLWVGILAIAAVLIRPLPPHPQIAPAIEHLAQGDRPILGVYTDILLWTFAGQFAGLIGWYRSHSQLDFQGRYRVWAWATVVLTAWGFFAGTSLHTAIAAVAAPQLRWPIWRAEVLVWFVPAALAGASVWWMADRDMQRHRLGLWLVRSAAFLLVLSGVGQLFAADLSSQTWAPAAEVLCRYAAVGLLVTGLWTQAWYVAYVNADPPEARAPVDWRGYLGAAGRRAWSALAVFGWFRALWPFGRRTVEAKPKRRTTKKTEEDEETPKRRRKPAAKKRAPAKSRTRTKPEPEPEPEYEEEEEAAEYEEQEETWEEVDDSTADSEEEWIEEEYEEEPAPPPVKAPVRAAAPPAPVTVKAAPPPPPKPAPKAQQEPEPEYSDSEDDEDGEDGSYRVDGGKSGQDMFKGLSKRQRRELKKQMKDQGRG